MSFQPVEPQKQQAQNQTSDEISNLIVEKQKEKIVCSDNLSTLQEERYRIEKSLLEIREDIRKGKMVMGKLNTEIEILTREYWSSKQ